LRQRLFPESSKVSVDFPGFPRSAKSPCTEKNRCMTPQKGDEKRIAAKNIFAEAVLDLGNPLKSLAGAFSVQASSDEICGVSSPSSKSRA
jgi:hypothetical protein